MSLADVQVILDALDTNRAAAFQKQQLAQQHDEFTKRLEQEHENMLAQHDIEKSNSRMNLALHASTNPNFLQSLPNVTFKGTTGDPGYQSPMIGGQPLALNPSRDPNQLNTYSTEFGDVSSPTAGTLAAQNAAQKLMEAKAELGPKEEFSSFENEQKKDAAAKLAASQMALEQVRESGADYRSASEQTTRLLGDQLTRQTEKERLAEQKRQDDLVHSIQQQNADTERSRYEAQYGTGTYTPSLVNAQKDIRLGNATIDEAVKDLPPRAKQLVAINNLKDGTQSIDRNQKALLGQLGTLGGLIGDIHQFNQTSWLDPTSWGDRDRLLGNIKAQLGNVANTLNSEPGRKAEWMMTAARGMMPQSVSFPGQNDKREQNFIARVRKTYDALFANINEKQRKEIFNNYGIDTILNPKAATDKSAKPQGRGGATKKYDPNAESKGYLDSLPPDEVK